VGEAEAVRIIGVTLAIWRIGRIEDVHPACFYARAPRRSDRAATGRNASLLAMVESP
jgi:hypothetical protein